MNKQRDITKTPKPSQKGRGADQNLNIQFRREIGQQGGFICEERIAVEVNTNEGIIVTSGAGFCTVYGKSATIPYSAPTADKSLSENE